MCALSGASLNLQLLKTLFSNHLIKPFVTILKVYFMKTDDNAKKYCIGFKPHFWQAYIHFLLGKIRTETVSFSFQMNNS